VLVMGASYFFYMFWKPIYALLLAGSTVVDYFVAILMAREPTRAKRVKYVVLSLMSNGGLLFFFKYFNFLNKSLSGALAVFGINLEGTALDVLLPIGLSFYTFQSLGYIFDVYRGKIQAERHFGLYAMFVSFWPQLVSGPIERAGHMLPQYREGHRFDYARVTAGLKMMAWGMFKKVVIADRLAVIVTTVYSSPHSFTGFHYAIATVFFAYQIYCDFSGYTDIAIGAAKVMGYELMDNFNRPYASRSTGEFWRRWHISLSSWFRDYMYIPLGGNRVPVPRYYLNLAVVFVVSGLWHGANWTFFIWGALHGSYLIISHLTGGIRRKAVGLLSLEKAPALHAWMQRAVTFSLVCFAWIFFRAKSVQDAFYIVSRLPSGWRSCLSVAGLRSTAYLLGLDKVDLVVAIGSILVLEVAHFLGRNHMMRRILEGRPAWVRWPAYAALVLAILNLGAQKAAPFIYFQF